MVSALSDSTRVCVYDRAGIGFSDVPRALNTANPAEAAVARVRAEDHTALRMANDLAALLMKVWNIGLVGRPTQISRLKSTTL